MQPDQHSCILVQTLPGEELFFTSFGFILEFFPKASKKRLLSIKSNLVKLGFHSVSHDINRLTSFAQSQAFYDDIKWQCFLFKSLLGFQLCSAQCLRNNRVVSELHLQPLAEEKSFRFTMTSGVHS